MNISNLCLPVCIAFRFLFTCSCCSCCGNVCSHTSVMTTSYLAWWDLEYLRKRVKVSIFTNAKMVILVAQLFPQMTCRLEVDAYVMWNTNDRNIRTPRSSLKQHFPCSFSFNMTEFPSQRWGICYERHRSASCASCCSLQHRSSKVRLTDNPHDLQFGAVYTQYL